MFSYAHGERQREVQIWYGSNFDFESLRGKNRPISCRAQQCETIKTLCGRDKRANRVLGIMIKRAIVRGDHDVALRPYKSQEIDKLERIQKRTNNMIRGLSKLAL